MSTVQTYDVTNCYNRLPCGICTRTNDVCPFNTQIITYNTAGCDNTVYVQSDLSAEYCPDREENK